MMSLKKNHLLMKKEKFIVLKKYWFIDYKIEKNLKWDLNLNNFFKKTNYVYFKHYVYLNTFLNKFKYVDYYLIFFFFIKLRYFFFSFCKNTSNFSKNFCLNLKYFLNYSKFLKNNLYSSLYKYNLIFFYKWWKIYEYFYVPKKLWFNKIFLKKSIFLIDFKNLFIELFSTVDKNFYFFNLINSQLFNSKYDFKNLFFSKLLITSLEKCFKYPILLDYNLKIFLKKNIKFWKYFYLFLKWNSVDYNSYWSFLNVSIFFTWSFLFQYNIPNSGLNMLYLKSLNLMYFWYGEILWSHKLSHKFIWDWWNFIYWIGQPYRSLMLGSAKKQIFLPKLSYSYENDVQKSYFYKKIKNKNNIVMFNNFIFINNKFINIKKKK